ncbi:DMT family transporter [Anaerocolumna sp.]|uniref:DMT family transporter n=1 Tax=Anaerocolumna sp. TaxID=2041569 RepID=UPI0028ABAD38|nr:EamA family transporter [Anaerocolumna sp.]
MKNKLAIGGLILVTIIWGGGFVASDMALESMGPFQIMAVRFLLATVLMGLISIKSFERKSPHEKSTKGKSFERKSFERKSFERKSLQEKTIQGKSLKGKSLKGKSLKGIEKAEVLAGGLMGVALFTGFAFQIVGLQYTTPSKNAFLTALNVVIVPFISFLILKKKIGVKGVIGALMSVAGVALLSLDSNFSLGLGDGLTLICAFGFAFQIFLTSEFVKKYRATVLNFIQMATAFLLSVVCLVANGETNFQVTTKGWLSVLYLGIISTTVCYLLQTASQKYVDETKAAIILSMESVFGTIFSIIILHEIITLRMVIGSAVILSAVIISNLSEVQEQTEETT